MREIDTGKVASLVRAASDNDIHRPLGSTTSNRGATCSASPVNSVADLVGEAHLWSRGDLVRRADPELGLVVMQGVVPLLSETPGRITGWSRAPGSDNDAVRGEWLGDRPASRATGG
jgi:crotonobetainyl-CoA:carnitine CoA-transferase CaiB-like acyl-CoA transferase